jgi:hypothetical protein
MPGDGLTISGQTVSDNRNQKEAFVPLFSCFTLIEKYTELSKSRDQEVL